MRRLTTLVGSRARTAIGSDVDIISIAAYVRAGMELLERSWYLSPCVRGVVVVVVVVARDQEAAQLPHRDVSMLLYAVMLSGELGHSLVSSIDGACFCTRSGPILNTNRVPG